MENPYLRTIKTFVLRAGRMTDAQRRAYENLSGRWCIPFTGTPLNYIDVFDNVNPVTIEIGFGMGKATAIIANNNPNMNYLGIEVHRPGVGKLLCDIDEKNLSNLYIIEHDAIEVLNTMISDNSVKAFHIFFPDPWPKKKHHKRRLVQRPITDLLTQKLEVGGYIYMATDWESYAEFALEELNQTKFLKNKYQGFAPHQQWRPETKFEHKEINAKQKIYELFFEKVEE